MFKKKPYECERYVKSKEMGNDDRSPQDLKQTKDQTLKRQKKKEKNGNNHKQIHQTIAWPGRWFIDLWYQDKLLVGPVEPEANNKMNALNKLYYK